MAEGHAGDPVMKSYSCQFCSAPLSLTGDTCSDRPDLPIGRCTRCDLVQVTDFSHVAEAHYEAESYFPENPQIERERQKRWTRGRVARLKNHFPDISTKRILDFGCGTGAFLEKAHEEGWDVIGYDLNPKVCELHRKEGWRCAHDLEEVPRDRDILVLFHVLEHLAKPWEFLADLGKRFPSAAAYVIEVPNTNEALNTLFENAAYRRNHFSADHVYYFTNQTLRPVVERAGLVIEVDSQLQRYTLANQLGWLKNNKGGGQNIWGLFNADELNDSYERVLVDNGVADSVFFICRIDNQIR